MKTKNKVLGAGIGLAALTYFLYGERGAKNRAAISGWTLQLKGQVLEKLQSLKDVNQEKYDKLVDDTAQRFARVKNVSASELKLITADLKDAWSHIAKQLK